MAPEIVLDAIDGMSRTVNLLDPMMGSGTVLAIGRSAGHRVIGVDSDPLAVLLARVWTTTVDSSVVRDKAVDVLERAKNLFRTISSGDAYPRAKDAETRKFVRYWFDEYARRQLAALAATISRVRDPDIRDVLWCGFSRLIITKQAGASLAMDLSHSRPHKTFTRAPVKPFRKFIAAVETVVTNCPQVSNGKVGPRARVMNGDARQLRISTNSIDLVVTSPPYLNAIDYLRCSKFTLVWMGYTIKELRKIRTDNIGAESSHAEAETARWIKRTIIRLRLRPGLQSREQRLLSRYIWDMNLAIGETARVLRHGGRAIYVVGDSTVRGTFIRNSQIVDSLAKRHGLSLVTRRSRRLRPNRRYLPPPVRTEDNALDTRMRREVIMEFRKKRNSRTSSSSSQLVASKPKRS